MKKILASIFLLTLAACAHAGKSPIAIVDTDRLKDNWPKFQNYNNQFSVSMASIDRSRESDAQKAKDRYALQVKYNEIQSELVSEVRTAATQVAHDEHYDMVVTHESVGYGGTDITPDVEKVLHITETSPSP